MNRPLVLATLAFVLGLLPGLGSPLPAGTGLLFLALASCAWIHPPSRGLGVLLGMAAAGFLNGQAGRNHAAGDCRTLLADGGLIEAHGSFASLPTAGGGATFTLESTTVPGGLPVPCRGPVRLRLTPGALAGLAKVEEEPGPAAGRFGIRADDASSPRVFAGGYRGWGRWIASPPRDSWPRDPARSGTMVLDSLRPDPLIGGASDLGGLRLEAQSRVRRPLGRHAAMGEALLLAQRDGLDPDLRDRFARAGLAHLLAISGFHVGLIAGGLLVLGRLLRLSQRTAALTSILVTGAYVLFLGAPHAAARAALQVGLVLVATMLQRPADPFALLAAAALLLTAIDPLAVLEPGFQLSFAGVAGIILLRRRILDQIPGQRGRALRESLATSIAATIATAPVCVVHFGQVAPVGVIANLLAIPLTAVVVPALALTISMGTISSGLATFLGGGTGLLLDALGAVAATAAALPGGSRFVPHDAVFGWVVGAAAVSAILLLPDRIGAGPVFRPAIRRVAAVGIVLAILVAWPLAGSRIGNGALEIHMIDVGQGDAIAIRTPAGRWILVDAGPRSGRNDAGRTRVVPFLLRNGVRSLEAIVLTHPDADHIGGAASVLAAFPVGTLVDPGRATGKSMYLDLLGTAERKGTAWVAARAGREIDMDGITIRVLYPRHDVLDEQHDANAFSVAFHLAYGGFGALFLGDAPAAVEEHLAAMYGEGLRANVIKVAHHGSRTSTADALLDVVQPELALISAGRHNRYGHPAPEVLRRLDHHGVRVLRTDLRGTISLRVSRDGRIESRTVR